MVQEVPQLFDSVKAHAAIARAKRRGAEDFLLTRLADELDDRLEAVLRDFPTVLDFGTPMPVLATRLARHGRIIRYEPDERNTAALDSQYDLIVSTGLFHRVNDLPGLLSRLRRALKPDGLLLAAFPGGDTLSELRQCLLRAESDITGNAAMRVTPMVDVRAAGQLLQRAGFALPVADRSRLTLRYASLPRLVDDLRAMGSSAAMLNRESATPGLTRAVILRAAELYASDYAHPDGKLPATFEFVWISGWAPHESQQKPLKPGSAKVRLADALRVPEQGSEKQD